MRLTSACWTDLLRQVETGRARRTHDGSNRASRQTAVISSDSDTCGTCSELFLKKYDGTSWEHRGIAAVTPASIH